MAVLYCNEVSVVLRSHFLIGVVHEGRPHEGGGRGVGPMRTDADTGGGGVRGNADVRKNNSYLLIAVVVF